MAVLNLLRAPGAENFNTTLSTSLSAAGTTMTLTSVTNLNVPTVLVIDRVDANGNLKSTSLWEYVYCSALPGGTDVTITRAQGGSTGQAHSAGAVVEAVMTADHWEGIYTIVNSITDDNGTGLKGSTATITGLSELRGIVTASLASVRTIQVLQDRVSDLSFGSLPSGVIRSKDYFPTVIRGFNAGAYSLTTITGASVPSSAVSVSVTGPSMVKANIVADLTPGASGAGLAWLYLDGISLASIPGQGYTQGTVLNTSNVRGTYSQQYLASLASGNHSFYLGARNDSVNGGTLETQQTSYIVEIFKSGE